MENLNQEEQREEVVIERGGGVKTNHILIGVIIVLVIVVIFLSIALVRGGNSKNQNQEVQTESLVGDQKETLQEYSITSDKENIFLNNNLLLHIDVFPDGIVVSEDGSSFGSSDQINEVVLSPDKKNIAISVSGAAHDFGWIYNIENRELINVAFSYGGGVNVDSWRSDNESRFRISTPKPSQYTRVISLDDIPSFRTRVKVKSPYKHSLIPKDGFEVFENEKYGFQLMYPSECRVEVDEINDKLIRIEPFYGDIKCGYNISINEGKLSDVDVEVGVKESSKGSVNTLSVERHALAEVISLEFVQGFSDTVFMNQVSEFQLDGKSYLLTIAKSIDIMMYQDKQKYENRLEEFKSVAGSLRIDLR